ncbi:MAG: hypothetical protein ACP5SK_03175 [Thermoprotei archaeon]
MGSKTSGLLAGATGGLVYGLGQSSYISLVSIFAAQTVERTLGLAPTLPVLESSIVSTLSSAVVFGAFFGLIYGWKYNGIPGRSPALKGMAMGILLFLFNMADIYLYEKFGLALLGAFVAVNAITAVAYGLILGYLYYRLELY